MKKIFTIITIIMLIATISIATPIKKKSAAKDPCAGNQVETIDCIDKKLVKAESDLDSAYFNATMMASEGQEKDDLIESQRIWKIVRDLDNTIMRIRNADTRGYGDIVIKKHYLGMTIRRTEELKFMYLSPEDPPMDF